MNPDTHFMDIYDRASRAISRVLRDTYPGTVLSIDIGGSFFDLIAGNAAAEASLDCIRAPTLLRYRTILWDNRFTSRASDVVAEPFLFGRVDGAFESVDDAGLCRAYVMSSAAVTTRTIDSWSSGRSPLRLVHFGDADHVLDQVRGASRVLAEDRPLITVYPARGDMSELLALFHAAGYEAVNLELEPRRAAGTTKDFGWIFFPNAQKHVFEEVAASGTSDGAARDRRVLDQSATPRQRQSSELFGIHVAESPQLGRTIPISEIVCGNDCYRVESHGELSWRWLGPRPRSRIAIPCAFPGAYRFEIDVFKCRMTNGLKDCRVFVEGREVATSVEGTDSGKIAFMGYLDAADYQGYVTIDIISPGALPYIGSDRRILRTSVSSVTVSPWQ
jgi:hypothetical protein